MTLEEQIRIAVREEINEAFKPIYEKIKSLESQISTDKLISNKEAQKELGVVYNTLMSMVAQGQLKQYPQGKTLKFSLNEIKEFRSQRERV